MWNKAIVVALLSLSGGSAWAQSNSNKLAYLIPYLFGTDGLQVDSDAPLPGGGTHSAHFFSSSFASFTQFNSAMATQLSSVPLPSPASGFTYSFDSETGVFARSTQSFGPIMSDRAETIGGKKFTLGFSYQRFSFDSIEGMDLENVDAVFTHDDFQQGGGKADVVTTLNAINVSIDRFTAVLTYGLADRLDVSLALPIVRTDLGVTSVAIIQRVGTSGDPAVHYFNDGSGGYGNSKVFSTQGSASGIGDIIFRFKANAMRREITGIAAGVDVRAPTGDEENLLGSGAAGVKPFVAISVAHKKISPHVNLAYQWNGESLLGGDVVAGTKADLPDQFLYVIGADIGVSPRLTVAFDLIGQRVIDSARLVTGKFTTSTGQAFPDFQFVDGSFNETTAAFGFKMNAGGRLLVDFNVGVKLDDGGLRDNITPLLGFEYSF